MSIDRANFEAVIESDLVELIEGQVPEGLRLEYKAIAYDNDDKSRSEAIKDISAFANAHGGHLILGISEKPKGLPSRLNGLCKDLDIDTEIRRLESLAQTGIEPRIEGLCIRSIRLQGGQHCIVLRIPRSWRPPHRVSRGNLNQFWIRNSAGAHEASVDELRTLFTLGASAQQLAAQFRDARINEFKPRVSDLPPNTDHGVAVLHLVPLASVTAPWSVDLRKAATTLRDEFHALINDGRAPQFTLDGMVVNGSDTRMSSSTTLYRDGKLEATLNNFVLHKFDNAIDAQRFEETIFTALPCYLAGLQGLDVPPPIAVFLTLVDVRRAAYAVGSSPSNNAPQIGRTIATLPPCLIDAYGLPEDYSRALRPAFGALWNTTNRARAGSFSEDGVWSANNFKPFRA